MKHSLARSPEHRRAKAIALHDLCEEVARLIGAGVTVRDAAAEIAGHHADDLIANADGSYRPLSVSANTLVTHYYKWLKAGRTLDCFLPARRRGRIKVPPELVEELHARACQPGAEAYSRAIKTVKRDWANGRHVPGLGSWQVWYAAAYPDQPLPRTAPDFPIADRTLYNYAPGKAAKRWGNRGKAAALPMLPHLVRDSSNLRPGEVYQSDDVRLDLVAVDDLTGKPTDMVAYIMYEVGSRYIPSFVMRPANAMQKRDVDLLIARGLKTLGIGRDYTTHIWFERGTLTMSQEAADLLMAASEGRIRIHWTTMNGDRTHQGAHADDRSGHWMGKGTVEALMRKLHLELMDLPGQRGSHYSRQPASLGWTGSDSAPTRGSLADEAAKIGDIIKWTGGRVRLELPLLFVSQVNAVLRRAITALNNERGHRMQGFGTITERQVQPGVWETLSYEPSRS